MVIGSVLCAAVESVLRADLIKTKISLQIIMLSTVVNVSINVSNSISFAPSNCWFTLEYTYTYAQKLTLTHNFSLFTLIDLRWIFADHVACIRNNGLLKHPEGYWFCDNRCEQVLKSISFCAYMYESWHIVHTAQSNADMQT